ncbi:MAG: HAD-superfamily hydrolase, subfamily variant 3 [Cytophagaceae bacterium]|jgi:putative hydrolase of the HAD superfamily|nr:HAD-superfamily hydrolase, subfamily variant 3 [Cytophagaceae bacterium]
MLELKGIDAIVFDLGGVIIDLDFQRSFDQFAALSRKSPKEIREGIFESGLLHRYEKGHYSDLEFLSEIERIFELTCDPRAIEEAFLALLLNIPPARIELIRNLSKDYRLFVLSNTSGIHYKEVNAILRRDTGHEHLDHLFEKVFLSFELGLLKPHQEIYTAVLDAAQLHPQRTLFLDDNADNLKGAAALGIRTALVSKEQSILTLFKS